MAEWGVSVHDVETGERVWTPPVGRAAQAATAATAERGFVATRVYFEPGRLVALDVRERRQTWTAELDHWPLAVAGGGDVVLAAGGTGSRPDPYSSPGELAAFDARSGDSLWRFETDSAARSLALVGSTVYAGTHAGTLYLPG